MAAPSYRCPFKVNATTNVGITCEAGNCGVYNAAAEECLFVLVLNWQLIINGQADKSNS